MGYFYCHGVGVRINIDKAFEIYLLAAAKGSAIAQSHLGNFFRGAYAGYENNPSLTLKWTKKAADQGFVTALYNMGLAYRYAHGVQKDYIF